MRYTTSVLAAAALLALAALPVSAGSMDVDLKAADGTMLKATYMSPGKPGPAMLLDPPVQQGPEVLVGHRVTVG